VSIGHVIIASEEESLEGGKEEDDKERLSMKNWSSFKRRENQDRR
jgi:hypothetical protein